MKLIYCALCHDVLRLFKECRLCICGESGGQYLPDGLHVEIFGAAIALGFDNDIFYNALDWPIVKSPEGDESRAFKAFVIPENCATVRTRK